ncbi:hypothetical protein MKEN_01316700 [Mycena kentingensis (nom. inval.)]|nr:hypothetical protein MKEN_01316700 [Mycena kentingensis (nom. inval.)]
MAEDGSSDKLRAEVARLQALLEDKAAPPEEPVLQDTAEPEKKKRGRPKGSKNKPPANSEAPPAATKGKAKAKKETKSEPATPTEYPDIPWKTEPQLSEDILTAIENNEARRLALGFTKGDGANAGHQTGAKQVEHYIRVIEKTLSRDPRWKDVDPKLLVNAVKSRLKRMREVTSATTKMFGETGAGLVETGREGELEGHYANLLEQKLDKYSWFLRMARLMHGSPVADTRHCSNSTTSLDAGLDAMVGRGGSLDIDDMTSQSSGPAPGTPFDDEEAREIAGDPEANDDDKMVMSIPSSPVPAPLPPRPVAPAAPAAAPTTTTSSQPTKKPVQMAKPVTKPAAAASKSAPIPAGPVKRKSMMDGLTELMANEREAKRNAQNARFEHERRLAREKQEGELALLKFQAEEREREFQRELRLAQVQAEAKVKAEAERMGGWDVSYDFGSTSA